MRSSPTPRGRCWQDEDQAAGLLDLAVAILADPEGPVLAAVLIIDEAELEMLRSSPTPRGRCWIPRLPQPDLPQARVAILADPEGPVLATTS